MPSLLPRALGQSARDGSFVVFLATVLICLLRARDLPSISIGVAGTSVSIGLTDIALVVTAVLAVRRLRARRPLPSPFLLAAAMAFAVLVFLSSLPNGAVAIVATGTLVELAVITLGAAAFVNTHERLEALLVALAAFATVAVAWGTIGFLTADQRRQGSFMGEHDMAALATMVLAVGLVRMHARRGNPGPLALVGIVVGVIGVVLGASVASVLGVYFVAAAVLLIAMRRGDLRVLALVATLAVAGAATAGTLSLRQGDLGFLQSWFGPPAETPGQYAASWSQRLIFTYIGGRVFLDQPVLGTGWYGELPPKEYVQYLPDARERFSDQPPHYFPRETGTFIPQQTYDQVLYELGLVGAAFFLALAAAAAWRATAATRRRDPDWAYVPAAWLASLAGVLAGAALFGGSPLATIFWLTLGVVAAEPEDA